MTAPVTTRTSVTTSTSPAPLVPAALTQSLQPASTSHKTLQPGSSRQASHGVSALSCSPRMAMAGEVVTCALHFTPTLEPLALQLASNTNQVRIPATVVTRPNQSSLTFQASVGADARSQSAIITATLADIQVQESILIVSTGKPVLTIPAKQIVKFGTAVHFMSAQQTPAACPCDSNPRTCRLWPHSTEKVGILLATYRAPKRPACRHLYGDEHGRPVRRQTK